ncbi:NADP oxidoreductase [Devosia yakushimensis]|uniref:NADP oxidoreductase n=1 Tax=Devosia yakushimensis TaxID=470028 RepID=A0ABQ5UK67_9HYPH|nr:NAD(P)-binding domain-containing protein [Devosia yakushimensis]GLQ12442.1 NADP oxidoreductase [Devosia yakushimensis]
MTIAIIGLGNMGKGLATRLAGKTQLVLGARDQGKASAFAATLGGEALVASPEEAAARADIVVLALPFAAALDFAKSPALAGKTLVDISNPIKPDFSGLAFGFDTSAAEQLQAAAPQAYVVKAYNTIFSALFALPAAQTADVPVFLAGNDEAAIGKVEELVKLSGFAVEKSGTLDAARLIEPVGMLNIRLGFAQGLGTGIAPSWVRVG